MAKHHQNWEMLPKFFKARSMAWHAVKVFFGNFDGTFSIKKEVSVVFNNTMTIVVVLVSSHYDS